MENQRVWLPPENLWQWYEPRLCLGRVLGEKEEFQPEVLLDLEGWVESLVEKYLKRGGMAALLYLLENRLDLAYLPPNPSPLEVAQYLLVGENPRPDLEICQSGYLLVSGHLTLEAFKQREGLRDDLKEDLSREEAEEEVQNLSLEEWLDMVLP